jgi:hypothetical protein
MTTRQPPRTALAKAQDDLAAALKRQTKAVQRNSKAYDEAKVAAAALREADAVVAAYTALVEGLTPKDNADVRLPATPAP